MARELTKLRAWRKQTGLTLDEVAAMIGISQPQLGRIERGEQPYNQDLLEALVPIYGCAEPTDLIKIDPSPTAKVIAVWGKILERDKKMAPVALRLLESLVESAENKNAPDA